MLKDKFSLPPVVGVCCVEGGNNSICVFYVVSVFDICVDAFVHVNVYVYL